MPAQEKGPRTARSEAPGENRASAILADKKRFGKASEMAERHGFIFARGGWVPSTPELDAALVEADRRRKAEPYREPNRAVPGSALCWLHGEPAEPSLTGIAVCSELCAAEMWEFMSDAIAQAISDSEGDLPQAAWPEPAKRAPILRGDGAASVEMALEKVGTCAQVLERHGSKVRGRKAICPFHAEKTPSLSLFEGKDGKSRFRCHGCDAHGDALDLEAHLSGESLRDTVRRWGR